VSAAPIPTPPPHGPAAHGLPPQVDWAAVARELQGLNLVTAPRQRRALSRDFHWYSPILEAELAGCVADLVVKPSTEAEVLRIAAVAARHRAPLTVRGGGTGNYGQCVPLAGGVVLDLTALRQLRQCDPVSGVITAEAGCHLAELDRQLAPAGRCLRLAPSTWRSATLGGFIAGGAGGIGSLRWGFLRDPGNLLGLEVVTVEPEPRLLQLDAGSSEALNHAYGCNGIITALQLPTTEAVDWVQLVVGFDDWDQALAAAQACGRWSVELNSLNLLEAPLAAAMPWPADCPAAGGEHRLLLLAHPAAMAVLPAHLQQRNGRLLWQKS